MDTTPGIQSNQSEVVRSVVVELKAGAVLWTYTVRSNHYGRNKILLYFNHLASAILAGQLKRIKAEETFESKLMAKKADAVPLRIQRALKGEGEPPSHSIIN